MKNVLYYEGEIKIDPFGTSSDCSPGVYIESEAGLDSINSIVNNLHDGTKIKIIIEK